MSVWIVAVICLLPVLLFMPWTAKFRARQPDIFGYVLSLVGTFVGVVVGLYFTDKAANTEKKNRTIKVLEASREEMQWLISRATTIDVITDTVSTGQRRKFYFLEMPPFFTETMRSELLSENLHPKTLEQFNIIRENLLFDVELLRKDFNSSDKKHLDEDLQDYKKQLNYSIEVMNAEITRLGGSAGDKAFTEAAQKRLKQLIAE